MADKWMFLFYGLAKGGYLPVKCMISSRAEAHSSVSSKGDLRTRGCWFDPWLVQYSFQGLIHFFLTSVHSFYNDFVGKAASGLERIF